jgi:RTX calcium-binding nonapeptide repeat (4 copies)
MRFGHQSCVKEPAPSRGVVAAASSLLVAVIVAVLALVPAFSQASSRPTCAGAVATQISHKAHIVAKPHAVVVALGARSHKITVARGDKTSHTICGGPGDDTIEGGNGQDILDGGPGNDAIFGRHANDLMVGDNYNPRGDALGHAGRDDQHGGAGNDILIGDNLASGDASGAKPDRLSGNQGAETIIGDSAVTGSGTASGGAADWIAAEAGDDLAIADSFSPSGNAIGGGDDVLNHALGSALMIGDSATLTGNASGGGNDSIHGMTGGDAGRECHNCDNRDYGDSYALRPEGNDQGSGNDLLTAGLADNSFLDGGGSNPGGGGRGKDLCAGKAGGHTVAVRCALYRSIWKVLDKASPSLANYGAKWPGRSTSPRP